MMRRNAAILAWIVGAAIGIPSALGFFILQLISPGLGRTDTAEIFAAAGVLVLAPVGAVYLGVLGFRGRLPGTSRANDQKEEEPMTDGPMGRLLSFISVILASSAVAAIVSATVVTDYVPEIYERRYHAGEVDWVITVESEILRETRDLRVRVPDDYDRDPDRRYPVLLVLDGEWNLDLSAQASSMLRWLGLGQPMIVVGVVNGVAGRTVDFVPPGYVDAPARADRFLDFIKDEALPAVDRDLRTTDTRVLAGYSLGGLFTLYSLVRRPDLFDGRLAMSPSLWRGDQAIVADLERFLGETPDLESFLYTSLGSEEAGGMREGFEALVAMLERASHSGLSWESGVFEGADHDNNAQRSTPSALRAYWAYAGHIGGMR
jgi:predicted alpha/beta superfamily hydrolase